MKPIGMWKFSTRIFASCAAVLLIVGVGSIVTKAGNPIIFCPMADSIAVAASPERVLVMTFCDNPRPIKQIDNAGNVTVFATLPPREPGCLEDDLHLSSGMGGWAPGFVYATQGTYIYRISPDGTTVSQFAMIPTAVSGLVFDKVGSFGYDMLVTGGYAVYRVSPAGTVTQVGYFVERIEGPDVAPMTFGTYAGYLFVGSLSGSVMAMAPTGGSGVVVPVPNADRVHFVPEALGTLNGTEYSFFTAVNPGGIVAYPQGDFSGYGGCALVSSTNGTGLWMLSWTGSDYTLVQFCPAPYNHDKSDFVDAAQPRPIALDVEPRQCPNWINYHAGLTLNAAILGTSDFDVRTIDPATVRLAGVESGRSSFGDVATPYVPFLGRLNCSTDCTRQGRDGYLDMSFRFNHRDVVRALGTVSNGQCLVITITGNTYDGRPFIGEDVIIIRKWW